MASADTLLVFGPDQVLALLRERQSEWRQRYQLQRIGLFGSMARNQATASSDVDVWVELDPLTPYATVHLKQELEELWKWTGPACSSCGARRISAPSNGRMRPMTCCREPPGTPVRLCSRWWSAMGCR